MLIFIGREYGKEAVFSALRMQSITRIRQTLASLEECRNKERKHQEIIMCRNLYDIVKSLPAKRQTKIATLSKQKIEEMIAHAAMLSDFRKAIGKPKSM
jgi:hypothetical protein